MLSASLVAAPARSYGYFWCTASQKSNEARTASRGGEQLPTEMVYPDQHLPASLSQDAV